ncbi:MAG: ABC transporter ATP-binding protein [Erysipelothrix sp.]
MIDINELTVKYGEQFVIKNLNLYIQKGSICTLIGPSGCGKTTLLYCITGLKKGTHGVIKIDGETLMGVRSSSSLILQDYGLFPWKTVTDNISFPLKSKGYAKDEINHKLQSILDKLGLNGLGNRYPTELSGGQRQRVALGRSLIMEPDLLLMDEATSALDSITKEGVQDQIRDLSAQNKLTVLVVTHNIEEAVFLGDRILVMNQGKITHDLNNDLDRSDDIRSSDTFHQQCLKVRGYLNETI